MSLPRYDSIDPQELPPTRHAVSRERLAKWFGVTVPFDIDVAPGTSLELRAGQLRLNPPGNDPNVLRLNSVGLERPVAIVAIPHYPHVSLDPWTGVRDSVRDR